MGSIRAKSAMTKYKTVALYATQAYLAIASFISPYLASAISSFYFTMPAVSLLCLRLSIKSTSSRIIPLELVKRSKIRSSPFLSCNLPSAI
jgi:hypothetical protein